MRLYILLHFSTAFFQNFTFSEYNYGNNHTKMMDSTDVGGSGSSASGNGYMQ